MIPHEDREWQILIPHGDIVDVFTPTNILFRGGGKFWPLMKINLMLLPQSTYCSEGWRILMWWWSWCDDDDHHHHHDDWTCGATSGLGRTCLTYLKMFILCCLLWFISCCWPHIETLSFPCYPMVTCHAPRLLSNSWMPHLWPSWKTQKPGLPNRHGDGSNMKRGDVHE